MTAFGFTPNGRARLDLTSGGFLLLDMMGAGAVDAQIQAVKTPSRDGETFVRAVLPPRFLIAQVLLAQLPGGVTTTALRRTLIAALNPKLGMGTVDYTPIAGGVTYEIDAVVAGGVTFSNASGYTRISAEVAPVSFRCPDPAWRESTPNAVVVGTSGGGLSVPVSIPFSLDEGGGAQTVPNTGDLDSYPVITTSGTFTGLTVTNTTTGKTVSFPGLTVTSPAVLTIDMDARTADVDGVNVMPYRSADSEAWALVPGANDLTFTVSSGLLNTTVTYDTRLLGV